MREFITALPEESQAEYEAVVERLETDGCLIEPFAKKLEKDLFEIRLRRGRQIRVFYFYYENNYIFGVHAFIKKTQKTPKQEIKKAQKVILKIKRGEYNE